MVIAASFTLSPCPSSSTLDRSGSKSIRNAFRYLDKDETLLVGSEKIQSSLNISGDRSPVTKYPPRRFVAPIVRSFVRRSASSWRDRPVDFLLPLLIFFDCDGDGAKLTSRSKSGSCCRRW